MSRSPDRPRRALERERPLAVGGVAGRIDGLPAVQGDAEPVPARGDDHGVQAAAVLGIGETAATLTIAPVP